MARLNVAAAAACLLFISCDLDLQESYYPTLRDAERDRSIARGCLLDFLPQSASDIFELHDLDSGCGKFRIRLPESDLDVLMRRLQGQVVEGEFARGPDLVTKRPWWPAVLGHRIDVARAQREGLRLFTVGAGAMDLRPSVFGFAVQEQVPTNVVVYFWY